MKQHLLQTSDGQFLISMSSTLQAKFDGVTILERQKCADDMCAAIRLWIQPERFFDRFGDVDRWGDTI
jgi:hypothetical protein